MYSNIEGVPPMVNHSNIAKLSLKEAQREYVCMVVLKKQSIMSSKLNILHLWENHDCEQVLDMAVDLSVHVMSS